MKTTPRARLYVLVGAFVGMIAVTAGPASASVSPAGTPFTATSTNSMKSVTFNVGSYKVSCTTSVVKGTTANPLSSGVSIAGGADITFGQAGGCTITVGALFAGTATISTNKTWDFFAGTTDPPSGSTPVSVTLVDLAATMFVSPVAGTTCWVDVFASSLSDLGNTYTNNTTSLVLNDDTIVFAGNSAPCPTVKASTGVITGQWSVTDAISVT